MLDDKDIFHSREATELLDSRPAPQWFSALFLIFNLLGARGVYYNLINSSGWNVAGSLSLWAITFAILIVHNRFFKALDKALHG